MSSISRIALCSDTHFWPGATRRYGHDEDQLQPWSEQIQAALLDDIAAVNPDLVLHLGDLTCGGGHFEMPEAAFQEVLTATVAAFGALPAPFYALPGNHDCPATGDWSFAERVLGLEPGLGRTLDLPAARLVLLHTQGYSAAQLAATWPRGPNAGIITPAELARVDEALATAGGRPVILFSHQLLRPWAGDQPWKPLFGIENGDDLLALLERHDSVRAVIQGHAHRLDAHEFPLGGRPCHFVVVPAVIEYPLGWVQIDLTPAAIHLQVRHLPLPELAALSRASGEGQGWRAGRPEWQQITIPL